MKSLPDTMWSVLDALRTCDSLHLVGTLPTNFDERAGPAYVDCLHTCVCWLSCDEVLLLCVLSEISVDSFELQGTELSLVASHHSPGSSPVFLKTDSNRRSRVRSHFEWIALQPSIVQTGADDMMKYAVAFG